MKHVCEVIAALLLVLAGLFLVFLLQGNPSLWDVLHESAMRVARGCK